MLVIETHGDPDLIALLRRVKALERMLGES